MGPRYMVCIEANKAVKGVFWGREEAIQFARKCAYPEDCWRTAHSRLSEMFLVFELHDDGSDILLERF